MGALHRHISLLLSRVLCLVSEICEREKLSINVLRAPSV